MQDTLEQWPIHRAVATARNRGRSGRVKRGTGHIAGSKRCFLAMEPGSAFTTDAPHTAQHRLSYCLGELANNESRDRVSIADVVDALAHRSLAGLLFFFALPNTLPMPPGTSAVLGLPLVILSAQLMLGLQARLPKLIANKSMARQSFAKVVERILPWISAAERLVRPRMSWVASGVHKHWIGALCLLLSIVLLLPIPFGNMLPAAAISMLALGLLERNGIWVLTGLISTVAAAVLLVAVTYGLVECVTYMLPRATQ